MAIFDWSLQTITRSATKAPSRSAVAAAAYRSGTYLHDFRTGAEHDFSRRRGIHSEIVLPPGVEPPTLVRPNSKSEMRSRLWNAAEAAETRRNSVVAREITLALPHELSLDDSRRLARVYAGHIAKSFGVAVDVAVHSPARTGDQRNIHAHVLFTTRRVSEGLSFGEKTRELDAAATGGPIIKALRERWATLTNLMLLDAGYDTKIDHRSLADRGIDREPGHHIGPKATNRARALRFKAAQLEAEAAEIEREVLPQLWSAVRVEAAPAEPERVSEGWIEWMMLHEQMRQAAAKVEEEKAGAERQKAMQAETPAEVKLDALYVQVVEEGGMEPPSLSARAKVSRPAGPKDRPAPSPSAPDPGMSAVDESPKPKARPRAAPTVRRSREKDSWER